MENKRQTIAGFQPEAAEKNTGKTEKKTCNNVLEYLQKNYKYIWEVDEGEEYRLEDREIEYAPISKNLNICFFHPYLETDRHKEDRDIRKRYMEMFLDRHKGSKYVKLVTISETFQAIGISVVCDEEEILEHLRELDESGPLYPPLYSHTNKAAATGSLFINAF